MESAEYKKKELAKMFIQHPGVLTFSCCTEKKKSDFFLLQKQNTTETVCSLIPEKCSVLKCQSFSFSCAACNIQLDSYTNTLKHLKVYKYYQHYFGKITFLLQRFHHKNNIESSFHTENNRRIVNFPIIINAFIYFELSIIHVPKA